MAEMMPRMIREFAIGAKKRVRRILANELATFRRRYRAADLLVGGAA